MQILSNIRGMDIIMVEVITVSCLNIINQVLVFLFINLWQLCLPVQFLVNIQQSKRQRITFECKVNLKSVVIFTLEVLIEILEFVVSTFNLIAFCAVFAQDRHFACY